MTFTATPVNIVGENFQPLAAATAASFSKGWPDIARAEITLPPSSTVTSTKIYTIAYTLSLHDALPIYRLKLNVIVPMTFTATPVNIVGENFQPLAAATAASFSKGWPEIAREIGRAHV